MQKMLISASRDPDKIHCHTCMEASLLKATVSNTETVQRELPVRLRLEKARNYRGLLGGSKRGQVTHGSS